MQGQGLKLTGPAPDGNIDEVMENVGSAAECGKTKQTNICFYYFIFYRSEVCRQCPMDLCEQVCSGPSPALQLLVPE